MSELTEADKADLDASELRVRQEAKSAVMAYLSSTSLQCFYVWSAGAGKGQRCPARVPVAEYRWTRLEDCDITKQVVCPGHTDKRQGLEDFWRDIVRLRDAAERVEAETIETLSEEERKKWLQVRAAKDRAVPYAKRTNEER